MAAERATATVPDDQPPATGLVVAAAAVRGAVVAVAGVLLTAGLALMVWAITPASGPDAAVAMRGGVTAFALANLMPVDIGDVTLSLPPLLLTAVPVTLLVLTARRGRFLPVGRYQESVAVLTTAGVYGLVVAATTRGYSTPGAVPAGWVWTAFALGVVATALGMLRGDSAWSQRISRSLPGWARSGIRGALVGSSALIGAGALVLSCGLILRFGTAVDISAAAAPSWLDGLGMTLLGLAYLPNAVVAAVGFLSGVGFEVGPGTYSPLATSTVDLPGVPLLAAAPQHDGRTVLGLVCLLLPLVVGYLVARPGVSRLVTRADRVAAAALAGALTGIAFATAAIVAGGGVGDGRWSTMGVPAWLIGPVIAIEVGGVACLVATVTGWRSVPWRVRDIAVDPVTTASTGSGTGHGPAPDSDATASRTRRPRRTKPATSEPGGGRKPRRRRTPSTGTEAAVTRATAPVESTDSPGPVDRGSAAGTQIPSTPAVDDQAATLDEAPAGVDESPAPPVGPVKGQDGSVATVDARPTGPPAGADAEPEPRVTKAEPEPRVTKAEPAAVVGAEPVDQPTGDPTAGPAPDSAPLAEPSETRAPGSWRRLRSFRRRRP